MERPVNDATLPIIDLYPRFAEGKAARRALAEEIGEACETIGLFYLRNHGLEPEIIAEAKDQARRFFAEPESEKLMVARRRGTYRGYIAPIRFSSNEDGSNPVRYEAFLAGPEVAEASPLVWPNLWPERPPGFAEAIRAYYSGVTEITDALLRCLGLTLAGSEDALLDVFRQPMTNISLLHYFPRPAGSEEDANRGHHDTNCLTILLPDPIGGLEVLRRDDRWLPAPPLPDCFTCNIGTMLALWSGDRFRSTRHRVHPPRGRDRYSIAYFASPGHDTLVEPLDPAKRDGERRHAGEEFTAFVRQFDED